ncbi:MAG: BMP family ABC transporter substrate-binding protein [Acidimicrobiia bacterium]|nr:BMP family ABC transporter substrate-binding protein [Acidimicrobiia bacterium]
MRWKNIRWATFGVALAMLLAACGGDSTDTTQAATTAAPAETTAAPTTTAADTATTAAPTTEAAAEGPGTLSIAMVMNSVIDEPWNQTQADALFRIQEASPYGLDVSLEFFEAIDFADAERVIGDMATSGEYDIIYGSSTFEPGIAPWLEQYPEIVFVYAGSGNQGHGGNAFWVDMGIYECTYLAGIAAGMVTETNHVAAVAAFPFPNVNEAVNGFIDGAQSVNPEIVGTASYIESWFDPATASEAATAQIAAGADVLYASSFGTIAGAEDGGVLAVGDYTDASGLAPGTVLTSALARWDGALNEIVDIWWDHQVNGTPYDAPMDPIVKLLAEDGCDIAPVDDSLAGEEVIAAVADAKAQILSGALVIVPDHAPVE